MSSFKRQVFAADSFKWLPSYLHSHKKFKAIITSLPDLSELSPHMTQSQYNSWLSDACHLLQDSLDPNGCIIFYQTNRKHKGILIDKEFVITSHFLENGFNKVFQKIVLRKEPGMLDMYRPTFSKLFCFSRNLKSGNVSRDVLPADTYQVLTKNGMSIQACQDAVDYIKKKMGSSVTILDPFCGVGTVLAVANANGMRAIGVDIDKKNVSKAKRLVL
jgi:ribosomal protein L11 methylase PrmA